MAEETSIWERAYDRRRFVTIAGASALAVATGGPAAARLGRMEGSLSVLEMSFPTLTMAGVGNLPPSEKELFYYNWADYVNPKTYTDFEQKLGVKVKKDYYVSNEALQAKLQAGARGFDLAVPTGYMVKILNSQHLLVPLDWSLLPHVKTNIDPRFLHKPFDPTNKYSVPKDWGTTGFMYRTDLLAKLTKVRPTSWRQFVDLTMGPVSGKVTILDGRDEIIGSLAVMLGHSYNTDDTTVLDQVKKIMLDLKPHVLAITSTEYRQLLIAGKAVMSLGWNGDGAVVASKKPARYVVPDEGGEFWFCNYVIPVGNKHPRAAHAWIDFTYTPKVSALETEYTLYGSPLKRALLRGALDPKVLHNPAVFPTSSTLKHLEANNVTPKGVRLRDRIWTEFKAA